MADNHKETHDRAYTMLKHIEDTLYAARLVAVRHLTDDGIDADWAQHIRKAWAHAKNALDCLQDARELEA